MLREAGPSHRAEHGSLPMHRSTLPGQTEAALNLIQQIYSVELCQCWFTGVLALPDKGLRPFLPLVWVLLPKARWTLGRVSWQSPESKG